MDNTGNKRRIDKGMAWLRNAIAEGYKYVYWGQSEASRECPICNDHNKNGMYYGGNCIWFSSAYLYHGMGLPDVKCACDGLLGGNSSYIRLLLAPYARAQAFTDARLGNGRFRLIRKQNRGRLSTEDLRAGDIIFYYKFGTFLHTAVYIGDGRIVDCSITAEGVAERSWDIGYPCRAAIRYIGN